MTRLLALALLASLPARASQSPQEAESEAQLESAQEARLQAVLRKVLASQDVLVIVDVVLAVDSRPRMTELLPGVPLKDTPAAADLAPVTRTSVRSIAATVILDESAPAEADVLAQKTAEQVLGLVLARGDAVTVRRMRLKEPLAAAARAPREWLRPAPVVAVLGLLAALAALALVYGGFLKPFLGVLRDIGAARAAPAAPAGGLIEPAAEKPPPLERTPAALPPPSASAPGEELPFAFLRERHVPMLKFLLQRAPAKTAGVIVHYLPPALAVAVLADLPAETRREVARSMSRVVQLDEENVRQIEDSLRSRIDYLMGGEDKLAEILDSAPPSLQEEMLAAVRGEEPGVAERLGRRIVRLDDLGLLEAGDLKSLSRRVPIRSLAVVLGSSEDLKARVMPKLTAGLGEWLAQEIQLAGALSGDRLANEQKRVLAVLTQMAREGAVKVNREGGAGTPALPAPAPEA